MTEVTGRFAIIEQFLADGMTHMFGNPGTVEQGFLDALAHYPEMRYILTLQETVAVMTADGFARATQRPTLVQIHSTPGLGNAIGALYQAMRGHAPLVVIGGDAGVRYMNMDAQMAGDLVAMARPVTKWSAMVLDPAHTLRMVRRAIKIAATPPMGPVYLCLPQDILDAPVVDQVRPTCIPNTRVAPEQQSVEQIATLLAGAERPMIFIGDGVAYSGAHAELTQVAELVGAEVWSVDAGDLNMSHTHACYQGSTGHMFGTASRPLMERGDVNLIVGTYVLPEVFPITGDIFAPDAQVIHIDLNAYEIAKNHRVDLGVVADPQTTLAQLATQLPTLMGEAQRTAAKARVASFAAAKAEKLAAEVAMDRDNRDAVPLTFARFMDELSGVAPEDLLIFDEALTNSPALTRYLPPTEPGHFFQTRGGSLGVGFPGAIGLKLAHPDKPVIGFSGDGGSMYTIQALWTAARHNVDAKFVVCNNASYRLLQLNIDAYWQEQQIPKHDFPLPFDLSKPAMNFAEMAQAMGVRSLRIEKPCDVATAIQEMFAHRGPFLLDVVIAGDTHPERVGRACGQ